MEEVTIKEEVFDTDSEMIEARNQGECSSLINQPSTAALAAEKATEKVPKKVNITWTTTARINGRFVKKNLAVGLAKRMANLKSARSRNIFKKKTDSEKSGDVNPDSPIIPQALVLPEVEQEANGSVKENLRSSSRLENLKSSKPSKPDEEYDYKKENVVPKMFNPCLRLVDLNVLAANLRCQDCKQTLSLADCVEDTCNIYKTVLKIKCQICSRVKPVPLTLLNERGNTAAYKSGPQLRNRVKILASKSAKLNPKSKNKIVMREVPDFFLETVTTHFHKTEKPADQPNSFKEVKAEAVEPMDFISVQMALQPESSNPEHHIDDDENESHNFLQDTYENHDSGDEIFDSVDDLEEEFQEIGEDDWFYSDWEHPMDQPFNFIVDHFPQKSQKCHYCEEIFICASDARSHMKISHPEYMQNICGFCKLKFSSVKSFKAHLTTHTADFKGLCEICGQTFLTSPKFLNHIRFQHEQEKKFSCSKCPKKFKRRQTLATHMHSHGEGFTCHFCSRKLTGKSKLRKHLMDFHVNKKTYDCEICNASFAYKYNRDSHFKNNHVWMCVICCEKFTSAADAKKHVSDEHSASEVNAQEGPAYERVTRFQCEICFRCLATKQALNKHKQTHKT